jgi:hypothetical protein
MTRVIVNGFFVSVASVRKKLEKVPQPIRYQQIFGAVRTATVELIKWLLKS